MKPTDPGLRHPSVTVLGVGDLMFGRGVASRLEVEGPTYPFTNVHHALRRGDCLFGNLETPLCDDRVSAYAGTTPRFAAPTVFAERMAVAGFDVVSLANNHILDQGQHGLETTQHALRAVGISSVGVIPSLNHRQEPVVVRRNGFDIGFLAYSTAGCATVSAAGAAPVSKRRMESEVREYRQSVDVLCVSIHAGYEWAPAPPLTLLRQVRALLSQGVDVVFGHHPHVPQGVLTAYDGVAFCSLGNFVSDMHEASVTEICMRRARMRGNPFASMNFEAVREGVIAEVVLMRGQKGAQWKSSSILIGDDYSPAMRSNPRSSLIMLPTRKAAFEVEVQRRIGYLSRNPIRYPAAIIRKIAARLRGDF